MQTRFRLISVLVVVSLAIVFVTYSPFSAKAWGDKGHRMISRVAAEKLPADMPEFFRNAVERLSYLGPEPDRWRDRSESEGTLTDSNAPEHFIDIDNPADFHNLPDERSEFIKRMLRDGKDPVKVGFLPYAAMDNFQRLRISFRLWRGAKSPEDKAQIELNAITYAGILGHYIGDGSMPLHTSDKFNGWRGTLNPEGFSRETSIHSRFESEFVDARVNLDDFRGEVKPSSHLGDPFSDIMTYLLASNKLAEKVYQMDKVHRFDKNNTDPASKSFVVSRIAAGSQMLSNLWYTAWVDSAKGVREF